MPSSQVGQAVGWLVWQTVGRAVLQLCKQSVCAHRLGTAVLLQGCLGCQLHPTSN